MAKKKITQKKYSNSTNIKYALLASLIVVIVFVSWFVWNTRSSANKSLTQAGNAQLDVKYVKKTTNATPAQTTTQPTSTTPTPTPTTTKPKTTTSSPAATTPSTPAPTPTQPQITVLPASITISADGCYVTATGSQLDTLNIDVFTLGHGGAPSYAIPNSGTITVSTGGAPGWTLNADLVDQNFTPLVSKSTTVTATCPPAT